MSRVCRNHFLKIKLCRIREGFIIVSIFSSLREEDYICVELLLAKNEVGSFS